MNILTIRDATRRGESVNSAECTSALPLCLAIGFAPQLPSILECGPSRPALAACKKREDGICDSHGILQAHEAVASGPQPARVRAILGLSVG